MFSQDKIQILELTDIHEKFKVVLDLDKRDNFCMHPEYDCTHPLAIIKYFNV